MSVVSGRALLRAALPPAFTLLLLPALTGSVASSGLPHLVSLVAFTAGALGLAAALALGLLARALPRAQYPLFIAGWAGLTLLCAAEVVVQGGLLVWLFAQVSTLLALAVGALVGLGAFTSLRKMFRRRPRLPRVDGERVSSGEGGALWTRLVQLAQRVGAAAPRNVIAGIDDNFFVTQAPVQLEEQVLEGPTLYVSLPLLRVLSSSEADAVLAHELAHLRGTDTLSSARLGPALQRCDTYLAALGDSLFTLPAFYVLRLFRAVFELSRGHERRRRELVADCVAAEVTSRDDLRRALLKVTAYSSHRALVERELFEHRAEHRVPLDLERRVTSGLAAHAASARFLEALSHAQVPHPFDSHPSLAERLHALGSEPSAPDCVTRPAATWFDLLPSARELEERLWFEYEARFLEVHARALAYRYLPQNDEERAVVERSFPARTFGEVRVTYAGVRLAGRELSFAEAERELGAADRELSATLSEYGHRAQLARDSTSGRWTPA